MPLEFDPEALDEWRNMNIARQLRAKIEKQLEAKETMISEHSKVERTFINSEAIIDFRVELRAIARYRDLLHNIFDASALEISDPSTHPVPGAEDDYVDPFDINPEEASEGYNP